MAVSRRGFLRAAAVAGVAAGGVAAGCAPVEGGVAGGPGGDGGTSPFTGEAADSGPVLAVKVDNIAQARPASGLDLADVVYVLPVEGGTSRLLGVFSSALPETVGPVRSLRESDLPLLGAFGRPAVACSGAHPDLLPEFERARTVPVTPDTADGAFQRDAGRVAPHNLYLDPSGALDAVSRPGGAQDVGFRFGTAPDGGESVGHVSEGYAGYTVGLDWSAEEGRWLVSQDGAPAVTASGARLSAATVVLQEVEPGQTTLGDPQTPYVTSVGGGPARFLRDGRQYTGSWERDRESAGTSYLDGAGEPMPFATGPVWVVMLPAGGGW